MVSEERTQKVHHISPFSSWDRCVQESEDGSMSLETNKASGESHLTQCLSEKAGGHFHAGDEFFKNGNTHPLGYRTLQLFLPRRWIPHRRRVFRPRLMCTCCCAVLESVWWTSSLLTFLLSLLLCPARSFVPMTQDFRSGSMQFTLSPDK